VRENEKNPCFIDLPYVGETFFSVGEKSFHLFFSSGISGMMPTF